MIRWNHRDCRMMPWKNGGGSTTELAIFPPGATLDDFVWRLSSADVAAAGPFSPFPGVDRSLAILSGDGLILHANNGAKESTRIVLDPNSPPYCFPGEATIHAELSGGPVLDLNLMTRREICAHSMHRLEAGEQSFALVDDSKILLYCVAGSALLGANEWLQAGDLVCIEEAGSCFSLKVCESAIVYLMRVTTGAKNRRACPCSP